MEMKEPGVYSENLHTPKQTNEHLHDSTEKGGSLENYLHEGSLINEEEFVGRIKSANPKDFLKFFAYLANSHDTELKNTFSQKVVDSILEKSTQFFESKNEDAIVVMLLLLIAADME